MAKTAREPVADSPGRGRPRDAEVDATILAAARTLLANNGYDAMSFEAISQMTGVTRPTIYRRWPTKAHLANQVANGVGRNLPDVIDRADLRSQLLAVLDDLVGQYQRPEMRAANAGLAAAYQRSPDLRAELHDPIEHKARSEFSLILGKAHKRGLTRPDIDADALFDMVVGAVVFRTLFSSLPLARQEFTENLCEIALSGIERR